METNKSLDKIAIEDSSPAEVPQEAANEKVSAWELVDTGRYRPRRIRGSCRGRELG